MSLLLQSRVPFRLSPFSAGEFEEIIGSMLAEAGVPQADVELTLMDDHAVESLNAMCLGADGPTNILSFPSGALPQTGALPSLPGGLFLGSMALSLDTLRRECFLYGQEPEQHCLNLLAHGLAHLLGHDHGPEMDEMAERLAAAAKDNGIGRGKKPF